MQKLQLKTDKPPHPPHPPSRETEVEIIKYLYLSIEIIDFQWVMRGIHLQAHTKAKIVMMNYVGYILVLYIPH